MMEPACAAENVDDGGRMVTQENSFANRVYHPLHHVNVLVNQPSDEEILYTTQKTGDAEKDTQHLNEKKNKFI